MKNDASRYKLVKETLNNFGETLNDMLNSVNNELSNFFNSKKGMCLMMHKMYLLKGDETYLQLAETIMKELSKEERQEVAIVMISCLDDSKNKEKGISRVKKGNE